jgi:hypothetical protein
MNNYVRACTLCEVVYTNPSHDVEHPVLRVVGVHPLLMWWQDDTTVVSVIVSKITLAGRFELPWCFCIYYHACLYFLAYVHYLPWNGMFLHMFLMLFLGRSTTCMWSTMGECQECTVRERSLDLLWWDTRTTSTKGTRIGKRQKKLTLSSYRNIRLLCASVGRGKRSSTKDRRSLWREHSEELDHHRPCDLDHVFDAVVRLCDRL